jgi:hypothetical protein
MLRKSVHNKDVIVKSAITITIDPYDHAVEVRHVHADRQGVPRLSDGIVVPVKSNFYCVMQIETGQGMEILALKEPVQDKFQRLMGFLLSFNIDRKLLSARVFLERMTKEWEEAPARFAVDALERFSPSLRDHIKPKLALLDHGTAQTLSDEVLDVAARRFMNMPPGLAAGD